MKIYYHFTSDKLRDGRDIPPVGDWLEHGGPLVICESGLHASAEPFDALTYAPGCKLHQVQLDGEIVEQSDKVCARRRKILKSIDATELLLEYSCWCALQVIDLWECPAVVRRFLETGETSLAAAAGAAAAAESAESARAAWAAAAAAESAESARAAWAAAVTGSAELAAWAAESATRAAETATRAAWAAESAAGAAAAESAESARAAWAAETAKKQGIDFRGEFNRRVEAAFSKV